MRRKWFIPLALIAMISVGAYAQQTDDQEDPEGNGGGGTSCTVTSSCFAGLGQVVVGSVSCTGTLCERGYEYVICNGRRTDC